MTAGGGTDRLVVRRTIEATREELFDAWTDPESMRVWMCPGDIISADVVMDLRVGGSFLITMRTAAAAHEHRGEFTIIERPSKLSFTWIARATDLQSTLVTVEFIEISETQTELVLTHENFPRTEIRERYQDGWSQIIEQLNQHLHSKR